MDHKRWAHELADLSELLYEAEKALREGEYTLRDYQAKNKMIEDKSPLARYYEENEVKRGLENSKKRVDELKRRVAGLTEKRNKWFDQEPPIE